jgi:RNA recognition motif-containing protein
MGRKLYCGNLSYNVSSSDLEQLFSQFGTVESAQVIADRDTGRSKGFGFVEMASDAEAQAAINGLNEKEHDGRHLTVNEAKTPENCGAVVEVVTVAVAGEATGATGTKPTAMRCFSQRTVCKTKTLVVRMMAAKSPVSRGPFTFPRTWSGSSVNTCFD